MASEPVSLGPLSSATEKRATRFGAIDGILVVLTCGLAFLIASTAARNSDLWLHLAAGRWLSNERLPDGTDPFSSATQGVFWVNHNWLSDIILYRIYILGDGAALVVAKAVVTALLAALMLCFRRRGEGVAVPALAGFAALLALGPWLLLQPSLVSLLGVLVTLYLLERARAGRWLLVPLFALWANLDGWFVLGPILVGLYALGELLRPKKVRSEEWGVRRKNHSSLPTPHSSLLFFACLAACLATPYHYRIFAWPTSLGLTHAEQILRNDPLGQNMILSPFAERFVTSPLFRSPGAWAYYFLLTAGTFSFLLSLRNVPPGRLLVWLALAALSIYQARTIPFFAVIAAPVLALNVQARGEARSAPPALRLLGVLVGVVLLVLVWPGWLQLAPYQPRDWAIEPEGSLVRMAEYLKHGHAKGILRPDRVVLTFSPEAAHHLAWFCPEEKGFVDSRWPLFDGVAEDYMQMRRCLLQEGGDSPKLAALLDAHRIDRILLYDADWERMARAYRHLSLAAPKWELLAIEGGATLFRRRGDTAPSPEAFDSRRVAYHPASVERTPPAQQPPQPPDWLDAFRRHPDPGSADREEAALHLLAFDLQTTELANHWLLAQATGIIGSRPGLELAVRLQFSTPRLPSPSEPLLLAVRAARRALAVNPNDARAFLILGEAYLRLSRQTREASWLSMLPDLAVLRHAQILTALEQAVLLRPDLASAHFLLAQLYYEAGQMDRCLDHLRERLRLVEQADKHAEAAAALRGEVERMEKLVNQSEKTYQANLTGKTEPSKVLDRAQLAARYGLTRKALEMMEESYPAIFGRPGVEYQLDLMIQSGQSYKVLEVLEPDYESMIDFAAYHWLKARAAASCGDYAEADAQLDAGSEPYRRIGLTRNLFVPVRSAVALHLARAVLVRPEQAEGVAGRVCALRWQYRTLEILTTAADPLLHEADREVLRGLLALEAGAAEAAKQHFRAALDVWGSDEAAKSGAGLDFPARPIAQEMLRRMEE